VSAEHFDVVIVGAGLSGIGAAVHLRTECPGKTFVILEGRGAIGGTWDLFRYPGIRSDSDMFTLGYSFKPWTDPKSIADGPSILAYIHEAAREHDIDRDIRLNSLVKQVSWSSRDARWTVETDTQSFTCRYLLMCAGYYSYAGGYTPDFPGMAQFAGRVVHPQKWPDDLDYAGKRVLVIGSGATAVTLVPQMAKTAAHVTMLQRSPTYIVAWPGTDERAQRWRKRFPEHVAYALTRVKNVARGMFYYRMAKRHPEKVKQRMLGGVRMALGPDFDIEKHFTPRYKPWDQRVCLAPDGDFFAALRDGSATVVTDQIETFTPGGVTLKSGETIEADIVVTATGLELTTIGDARMIVDGKPVDTGQLVSYKGVMASNVPNYSNVFGYTNASWTLKADLIARYVCRLLNYMDRNGYDICCPRIAEADIERAPMVDFTSGYFARAYAKLPKQGTRAPWRVNQNYLLDTAALRFGTLEDGVLKFSRRADIAVPDAPADAPKAVQAA
jgi:cation diffusion facilitator CzcD-associated flavoprotein CzcO